jgi:hypothetical protein
LFKNAVAVNEIRNVGTGQFDQAAAAAAIRDKEIESFRKLEAAGATADKLGVLWQKIWQDFDARLGNLQPDRAAGVAPIGPVNVTVSGVLDTRTIDELTTAFSRSLMQSTGRQFGAR